MAPKEHNSLAVVDSMSSPFQRRQLAGMIGVLSAISSSFYVLFSWMLVYLSELQGIMKEKEAKLDNFFVVGMQMYFIVLSGKLSDAFPHCTFGILKENCALVLCHCPIAILVCLSLMQGTWQLGKWTCG
ncbi:hypothetical protein ACA910_001093 [Epithemia clementina (nom. ined.)]